MSGAASARLSGEEAVERALARVAAAGADQADAVYVEADSLETRVRDDEIDFVKQARERQLGIRALVGGTGGMRSAVTSTSDLSPEAVDRMAEETAALARATALDPAAGLPEAGFAEDADGLDLGLLDDGDRGMDVDGRIDAARRAETAARASDPRIVNSEGSQASSDFARVVYGNSRGFRGAYGSASHGLFSEPVARENGAMQRDYWMTVGRRLADLENAESVGRRAAERALRRLGARKPATCEAPVLFDAVTAPSLLRNLVACVSGYAVYRETSFLADRLGERVGSSLLSVVDDGRRPRGLGSKPFDGEGLATRRNVILEDGVLRSWLLDSYSARKLGLESTGNASRGAGSGPGVGPTNLWLEPDPAGGTLADLVADTPRGLLVTELIGQGFNPVTGDYSRGAAGLWIENGEIAYPVEEITIAGDFGEMLAGVDRVGAELEWLGRVAAPPVRIGRMTIAGG